MNVAKTNIANKQQIIQNQYLSERKNKKINIKYTTHTQDTEYKYFWLWKYTHRIYILLENPCRRLRKKSRLPLYALSLMRVLMEYVALLTACASLYWMRDFFHSSVSHTISRWILFVQFYIVHHPQSIFLHAYNEYVKCCHTT